MKKLLKTNPIEILHYYILAFFLLMGYYIGDFIGITKWAFVQPLPILLLALTIYYGTFIWVVDSVLHKVLNI
jgi:hypothetical protein